MTTEAGAVSPAPDPPPPGREAVAVGDAAAARPEAAAPPALLASLRQLALLRSVAIAAQGLAIATALALHLAIPAPTMAVVVAGLVAFNLYVATRIRSGRPAAHGEVATHLAVDLAAFTALLVPAGGSANPFVLVYVLHVVLIAMLLPRRMAAVGTLAVVACFAVAFARAQPLRLVDGRPLPESIAALGLAASFVLTAAITAWFITRVAGVLREHERLLRETARRALNDEAVLRIGTLAAGAAHELGTPLTTMAVLAGEMRRNADTPERERDARILSEQIDACRRALENLRAAAGHVRGDNAAHERVDAFVATTLRRFGAMRPDVPVEIRTDGSAPAPEIRVDPALAQAMLILLNNAADASPERIEVDARWDAGAFRLTVGDRGAGVPEGALDRLGRAFFTTKPPGHGTGLGLVLAASTVDRLGGTVRWSNRPEGGLAAEIRVPLRSLAPETAHR